MTTAGIYTRLSLDRDGNSTATERQRQDCTAVAERLGLDIVKVYEDNDVSAFNKKKRRPAFEDMVLDLGQGRLDHVIVWRSDRLARQPRDLERFLDAAEKNGASLLSVTEPEFGGRTGLLMLRMLVNFASHESGVKSERVARKIKEQAELGHPKIGGARPFGLNRDYTPHPVESPLYLEAVDRVLAGERPASIARDWIERGVPTVKGGKWTASNFHRLLRAPSQGGIRSYHGRLIDGTWGPLIPRERWERLQVVLQSNGTGAPERTVTRHFLTGLAYCALCGVAMQGTRVKQHRSGEYRVVYRCSPHHRNGCGRVSIDGARLEDMIVRRFLHVAGTDRFAALATGQQDEALVLDIMSRLREDEASLAQLTKDHYVDRAIPRAAFLASKDALEARMTELRDKVAQHASPALSAATGGADALQAAWANHGAAWRRSVLEAFVRRVVVKPAPPGKRGLTWWTDRVAVEWTG